MKLLLVTSHMHGLFTVIQTIPAALPNASPSLIFVFFIYILDGGIEIL